MSQKRKHYLIHVTAAVCVLVALVAMAVPLASPVYADEPSGTPKTWESRRSDGRAQMAPANGAGTVVTEAAAPAPQTGSPCYLLGSSQFGELFAINQGTGSARLIATMPLDLATEIEYDHLNDMLYAEEVDGGPDLHTIKLQTGASLGTVTHPFGALNGLEFVGSTLYGTFIDNIGEPADLVIVDTATGNLTTVGPTGLPGPVSGLAYDEGAGVMYGVTAGGVPADLVTIDLNTGTATVVGPTGLDRVGSIEFCPDGTLYGGTTDFASTFATYLVRIDPTTGHTTPIGATGYSITGLTTVSGYPVGGIVVPTDKMGLLLPWMGPAALAALAALGLVVVRRRVG